MRGKDQRNGHPLVAATLTWQRTRCISNFFSPGDMFEHETLKALAPGCYTSGRAPMVGRRTSPARERERITGVWGRAGSVIPIPISRYFQIPIPIPTSVL